MGKKLIRLQAEEAKKIHRETAIERKWWSLDSMFLTKQQSQHAVQHGLLVTVPQDQDGFHLIGRLNDTPQGEPNTIRPIALSFLRYAVSLWQQKLNTKLLNMHLAVTSLYRTEALQLRLSSGNTWYRAVGSKESSHLAGAAIDISCRSYYLKTANGFKPVQAWDPQTGIFEAAAMQQLHAVLVNLMRAEHCNLVVENKIEEGSVVPSVYHICTNPEFKSL